MNDSQLSGMQIVTSNVSNSEDVNSRIGTVRTYISDRIEEVGKRWESKCYSRSVFDFVDMAIVIGALANMTDTCANNFDSNQYIDFVKNELILPSETQGEVVATAFYCLVRCGLVHEMSLGGHNKRSARKQVINGYSIFITHDKSSDGEWYSIDTSSKEIVFYAHQLLQKIKSCVEKCFDGSSSLWCAIRNKVNSNDGVKIIAVK